MHVARLSIVLGWLAAGLFALGCAGPDTAAKRQLEEFRKDIDRIQADNDRLDERVASLEGGKATDPRGAADAGRTGPGTKRIDGDAGADDEDPEARGAEDGEPTVIRAEGTREPTVKRGTSSASGSDQAARAYEDALELVKDKKYDEALEALAGYLVRYPGEANADNAMYWRGECYYAKGNYVRAAEQFEGVLTRFPNGNKAPDALLKLGLSQRAMGERDKAKETFDRLRKSFPSSDLLKKIPRE